MSIDCPIECINRDLICASPPDFLEKHNGFVLTYFLKSRCKKIKCFGLECDRTPIELEPDQVEIVANAP